jgi:hypothetical protein
MIACITSQRLCLLEEVTENEYIVNQFDCTEEQWEEFKKEWSSWNMSGGSIYLNWNPL